MLQNTCIIIQKLNYRFNLAYNYAYYDVGINTELVKLLLYVSKHNTVATYLTKKFP